jgi:hypothetical protein
MIRIASIPEAIELKDSFLLKKRYSIILKLKKIINIRDRYFAIFLFLIICFMKNRKHPNSIIPKTS